MYILGISAYHGDASATLVKDGELIGAVEEERFNRLKHCAGFPWRSVKYCLEEAGITIQDVDHIAISRDPSAQLMEKILFSLKKLPNLKFGKFILDRLGAASKLKDVKTDLSENLNVPKSEIRAKIHNIEHHVAHIASAFLVSGFEEAAILSIDGFGDFASSMKARGRGNNIEVLEKTLFPHSIGMFYTMICQYLGFPKYGDEGKVMGLASYGEPRYMDIMRDILRTDEEKGQFSLGLDYFRHHIDGVDMNWDERSPTVGRLFSDKMIETFGPARDPKAEITQDQMDIASSMQYRTEEVIMVLLNDLHQRVGSDNLTLAGGVALNCVANGKILDETPFKEIYIQPAAGDNGTSLGAAFYVCHSLLDQKRRCVMDYALTGPAFDDARIRSALEKAGLKSECPENIAAVAAKIVSEGKILGWYQGRMEFGPRALGNRSIIADPRRGDMKDILNSRIKHREPFRPFAPSILEEYVGEIFETDYPSPFMLMAYKIKKDKRKDVQAINHIDNTGRLQSVSKKTNPLYWELIDEFRKITGVPVVLNTSFNENEPIVCTPEEAINCFVTTKMDALVMGKHLILQ